MFDLARHIEVELELLPTAKSGRRAPIFTGFQSTFQYDGGEWDAFPVLEQLEFVFPGQSVTAFISFRSPQAQEGRIAAGKEFKLHDGHRVIGLGRVTRVLGLKAAEPASVSATSLR